jgi:ribosomal protein S18 acetylase RimI-like enzyme
LEDNPVITRRAARSDADAISALWRQMMDYHARLDDRFALDPGASQDFTAYLDDILENYIYAVFVACERGKEQILGYTIVTEMDNPPVFRLKRYGFISEICVAEGHQGRGVGKALLDRANRWFRRRGLKVAQLNVSPHNKTGLEFYHKRGFSTFLEILWLDLEEDKKRHD